MKNRDFLLTNQIAVLLQAHFNDKVYHNKMENIGEF